MEAYKMESGTKKATDTEKESVRKERDLQNFSN
jgi:hypothetical protein